MGTLLLHRTIFTNVSVFGHSGPFASSKAVVLRRQWLSALPGGLVHRLLREGPELGPENLHFSQGDR